MQSDYDPVALNLRKQQQNNGRFCFLTYEALYLFLELQSNLGLTDKCGPTTVRCWKKSVKRKRSVPHSVTIVCTSTS